MLSERGRSGWARSVAVVRVLGGPPAARGGCDRVIWAPLADLGASGALPAGFYPPAIASWRPIGLRLTSVAAQLACSVAFSVPMYLLLRAP